MPRFPEGPCVPGKPVRGLAAAGPRVTVAPLPSRGDGSPTVRVAAWRRSARGPPLASFPRPAFPRVSAFPVCPPRVGSPLPGCRGAPRPRDLVPYVRASSVAVPRSGVGGRPSCALPFRLCLPGRVSPSLSLGLPVLSYSVKSEFKSSSELKDCFWPRFVNSRYFFSIMFLNQKTFFFPLEKQRKTVDVQTLLEFLGLRVAGSFLSLKALLCIC